MSSIQQLRRRIRSTRDLVKVTRAMQAVSASKVRRVQQQAVSSRPYYYWAKNFLKQLSSDAELVQHIPWVRETTPARRLLMVVLTSDRGLCGAYNQNVLRQALQFYEEHRGQQVEAFTIGRKGRDLLARAGVPIRHHADAPRSVPTYHEAQRYARLIMEHFALSAPEPYDEVYVIYTRFKNVLTQETQIERYLPIQLARASAGQEFVYEPEKLTILEHFLPQMLTAELYHYMLESSASEHAARMVAMENASRNAEGLVQELTLAYNKARQQLITNELLDIAGGAEALQAIR